MNRRDFLKATPLALLPALSSCGYFRIDPWHVLIRSPYIENLEQEAQVMAKAKSTWTDDGRIRVVYVSGTPYERGYQQGKLLRKEINDNLGYIYEKALDKFHFQELFAEVYERQRPYIPQEYIDEMHGLAHGARMPLHVIHHLHILPEIGEWGGKKKIKKVLKQMMAGELGTSCSNFAVHGEATLDQQMYAVRILDWGLHRISKLHQYPLITVGVPDQGHAYCNISWCGFLGAVSGMNEAGITLGEMGYGDPPNERLDGKPMPFLLRDIMTYASNLAEVRHLISTSRPTASFGYLMTDGKTGESELYVRDPDRFLTFQPGVDLQDKEDFFPARPDTVYGGHYEDVMADLLQSYNGKLEPQVLMDTLIPKMAMKSNFQNVVYHPSQLRFWVNNALNKEVGAHTQPYTLFEFGRKLAEYRALLSATKSS